MAEDDNMVEVRGAYKQYTVEWNLSKIFSTPEKPHLALAGLDMTVAKGSIYSLLGPSGCGKTTLLSCIIGRRALSSGHVKLGVNTCSQIGYMPQEVALQRDLSIAENISFYGYLFNVSKEKMDAKMNKLYHFLELPSHHFLVGQISGGQQRRVSFFIALLHDPELLVLDEPTVGLDPCLSQKIWEYFIDLSTVHGKTVLITTHYIEEARKADKVGLMRKGDILEEGNPIELMAKYDVQSMDELFLKVTMQRSADKKSEPKCIPKLTGNVNSQVANDSSFSIHRLKSGVMNSFYCTKRNLYMMFLLLVLPLIDCGCFQISVGRKPDEMKLGIINDELTRGREYCNNWQGSCFVNNFTVPLSCGLMDELERQNIKFVEYEDAGDASYDVYKNHIWGYIHVPANYTPALLNRLEMNQYAEDWDIENSLVGVHLDKSIKPFHQQLQFDVIRSYFKFLERLYESCGWKVAAAGQPITENPVYGSNDITFTEFSLHCIVIMTAYILPVIHVTGVIVAEKSLGIWDRFFVSGMNIWEVIIGHISITVSMLVVQVLLMIGLLFVVQDNILHGSILTYSLLTFTVGITGVTFGVLTSVINNTDFAAAFFSMGNFIIYFNLCGIMWPVQGMNYILRKVSWFLPLTLPAESLRSISSRAWGLSYPLVVNGFLISFAWNFIHILLLYGIIKYKKMP